MVKKKKKDVINVSHDSDSDSDVEIVFESHSDSEDSVTSDDVPTLVINVRISKHVRFSDHIVTHVIAIEDRKGYWTEDRFRFQQRCASVKESISFIFEEVHRRKMRLIVNLSDRLRGAVMPSSCNFSSSHGFNLKSYNTNISRGRTLMYVPMPVREDNYPRAQASATWQS